jgi:hypothetical protein
MTNACPGALRFISIFAATIVFFFGGFQKSAASDNPEPVAAAKDAELKDFSKTSPPPQPPYKLSDSGATQIDQATNRPQNHFSSLAEVEKKLTALQVRLAECDKGENKTKECTARQSAMYCMYVGDQHMILKQNEDAKAFFLEALTRTFQQNEILEADYKIFKSEIDRTAPAQGHEANTHALTGAYNAAKYHFYAYKNYAEMARYQKRLVETFISMNLAKAKIAEQWEIIENSLKTAAKHHKEFKADVMKMDAIKDKLPGKYMIYFSEIAALAAKQGLEML